MQSKSKVRFVYHNAKDSWLGKGIVGWTYILALVRLDFKSLKHNFSHTECWFPDENGEFRAGKRKSYYRLARTRMFLHPIVYKTVGQCFSSTTRGDSKGVRFAPASEVLHHPERWMYQEYEVDDELVDLVIHRLEQRVGRKYDYAGIFGFFLPWNTQDDKKDYCSEDGALVGWWFNLTKTLYKRISPRRLAKVLGGELKELK